MKNQILKIRSMASNICSNLNEIPGCDVSVENNAYIINAYNIASDLKQFIDDWSEKLNEKIQS